MRVYISGPMKNKPDLNRAAFAYAEKMLTEIGYETINPHNLSPIRRTGESEEDYYERCMDIDLAALQSCDRIYLLAGWMHSSGAMREFNRAMELGIRILA